MKKLEKLSLKQMEQEMTVIGSEEQYSLKGGEVTLVFDRSDSMIYIMVDGITVESHTAHNIVDSSSQGQWSNGSYSMYDSINPYTHSDDAFDSSYGTHGIYRANPFYDSNGCYRTGMGIHSGRSDNTSHPTMGCIRTTDAAMANIKCYAGSYGGVTSIIVQD
ncbi:MAG: hypothetical protein ACQESQ_06730 [Bacteroidota bacterium]